MPRRLLPVAVLMAWMSAGLLIVPAGAGEKPAPKEAETDTSTSKGHSRISDLIIVGSKRMSAEQIKKRMRTQVGKEFKPADLDEDVRELYKTNQFSNIQTFTEPDGPGRVKVRMHFLDLPNKVQKVTFLGAKHLKEEDLRKATGVRIDMPLNPNLNRAGCQKILDKYAEQGRSFSSCELIKGGQLGDTEVIYSITEGPKVRVRDVQFIGNTFVSGARLATQIHSSHAWFHLPGGTFNRRMAEADVNELINYFKSFGYKDVKVSLETRPSTDGSEIALIFHIQEGVRQRPDDARRRDRPKPSVESLDGPMEILRVGDYLDENQSSEEHKSVRKAAPTAEKEEQPLARIGHIILTGNKRISDESILAHVSLFPGQVLRYPDLKKAENALAELGLFVVDPAAGVRPTITVLDSGSAYKDILITVKEKRTAGKPR